MGILTTYFGDPSFAESLLISVNDFMIWRELKIQMI